MRLQLTQELVDWMAQRPPDAVVIEVCNIAGSVGNVVRSCGAKLLVADPTGQAWQDRCVKRKADRDDARKLEQGTPVTAAPVAAQPTP